MKTISCLFLLFALCASTVFAVNIYEANVDRHGRNQEGKRFSPPVKIQKLSDSAQEELRKKCEGDFAGLPELPIIKGNTPPWYPFEMRRNGQTATVNCIVAVSIKGEIERIFRVGEDSDLFFKECARALVQWKLPSSNQPGIYRISFTAGLFELPPSK